MDQFGNVVNNQFGTFMAVDDVQLKFRVAAGLKTRLEAEASANHRSLSAEIASRLERSVREEDGLPDPDRFDTRQKQLDYIAETAVLIKEAVERLSAQAQPDEAPTRPAKAKKR